MNDPPCERPIPATRRRRRSGVARARLSIGLLAAFAIGCFPESDSSADWSVVGVSGTPGYLLCAPKHTLVANAYLPNWPFLSYFPHGTIKSPAGNRLKVQYNEGQSYPCRSEPARRFPGDATGAPALVVLTLWSGETSNAGGGAYNTPGTYSGVVESVFRHPGTQYCADTCP